MTFKKIFFDFETTSTSPKDGSPHQIAALLDVGGSVEDEFTISFRPYLGALVEQGALDLLKVTKEELYKRPIEHNVAFNQFIEWLKKHIGNFDKNDKAILYGYNNCRFDNEILQGWFNRNNYPYFGAFFKYQTVDVYPLIVEHFIRNSNDVQSLPPSFKLGEVGKLMGVNVDENGLHDALFDVRLLREIYYAIP